MAQGVYSGGDLCKDGAKPWRGNAGVERGGRRATPPKNGVIFHLALHYMHSRMAS